MEKVATNKKIIRLANVISKAIEAEAEDILQDAEVTVKQYIPARYVKAGLEKVEKILSKNGIEAAFDKKMDKEAFKKTASMKPSAHDIHDTLDKVAAAVVAEMEDVLADAEEVIDDAVGKFDKAERYEAESKMKNIVAKRMKTVGISCQFNRTDDKKAKLKAKILASIKANRKKAEAKKAEAKKDSRREKIRTALKRVHARRELAKKIEARRAARKQEAAKHVGNVDAKRRARIAALIRARKEKKDSK